METVEIKKGSKFLCIKEQLGRCIKGKYYYAEKSNSISLEFDYSTSSPSFIKEHFKQIHDEESE